MFSAVHQFVEQHAVGIGYGGTLLGGIGTYLTSSLAQAAQQTAQSPIVIPIITGSMTFVVLCLTAAVQFYKLRRERRIEREWRENQAPQSKP